MFRLRFPHRLSALTDSGHESAPFLPGPNSAKIKASNSSKLRIRRRRLRLLLAVVLCILLACAFVFWASHHDLYNDIRLYEAALPQHRIPRNPNEQFIWFEGQLVGHGLNNVLQEILMMSYVAYAANRSFVFQDYIWNRDATYAYVRVDSDELAVRPARIPLNAFISGPTAGGPFHSLDDGAIAHRAVTIDYFEKVCPKEDQKRISSDASPIHEDGKDVLDFWEKTLANYAHEPCLVVEKSEAGIMVFDWELLGSTRSISLYDALAKSPILKDFEWSPLIQNAVRRNSKLLFPSAHVPETAPSRQEVTPGLIAVHIRRGDYFEHCRKLWDEHIIYMGMNQSPWLKDHFDPPPAEPEHKQYYYQHCLPTVSQLVDRLRDLRDQNPSLHRVYVLSNATKAWLKELSTALKQDGWGDVKSTLDLSLSIEERFVDTAVDMATATKAEVFLGNGFSSLSSNIIMLRMAHGLPADSNRLL